MFAVVRLMLLTIIITYFTGCAFYFVAAIPFNLELDSPNFIGELLKLKEVSPLWKEEDDIEFYDFITVTYFSITTLSTVGFGDAVAKTNIEKIVAMFIMFGGVGFFSFIMGSFIEVISSFSTNIGVEDRTFELNNWMKLLVRFRGDQPLPNALMKQIH